MKKLKYIDIYRGLPREMYVLFVAKVITCMGAFIMPLWTLILTQKIGLSKPQTGLLTTVFAVTQAPCLLLGGQLIDTVGRKKMIFICQSAGALFYIACAFAGIGRSTPVLIMIAADFYVMASPALDAIIADVTHPDNRKASFSLIYLGMNLGFTVSPLLGGLLFERYLAVLFVLDAITTLISTALILIYVREPALRNAGGQISETGKSSVFRVLWKEKVLLGFMLVMIFYQFCYFQWSFTLPLQMADRYRSGGARNYTYLVALNSFSVIVFTPLATVLIRRLRPLMVIAAGGLCYFAAFAAFALVSRMPEFLAAAFVLTMGEIVITVNISTFVADHSPPTHRGRINSINSIVQGSCYAVAPLIMGNVIAATNYFTAWTLIAALMLTGALSMFALDRQDFLTGRSHEKIRSREADGAAEASGEGGGSLHP